MCDDVDDVCDDDDDDVCVMMMMMGMMMMTMGMMMIMMMIAVQQILTIHRRMTLVPSPFTIPTTTHCSIITCHIEGITNRLDCIQHIQAYFIGDKRVVNLAGDVETPSYRLTMRDQYMGWGRDDN